MKKYAKESKIATGDKMPTGLPDWVKKIGLTEPKGMEVNEVYSTEKTVDNPHEGELKISATNYKQMLDALNKAL